MLLSNRLYYRNGKSGVTRLVGNDEGSASGRRIVRYEFAAPDIGASLEKITIYSVGLGDGNHVPLRFYIGTDPEDHANAGGGSDYTGELTLGNDLMTFTAECRVILLPGKTYYLWIFPASDDFGYYWWPTSDDGHVLELSGGACVVPVVKNGETENRLLAVAKGGKLWLCMPVAVIGGKPWIVGPGGDNT